MKIIALLSVFAAISFAQKIDIDKVLDQAIANVDLVNMVSSDTLGEDHNPNTQKADGDSIVAQRTGDILQEITRILVQQYGSDVLSQFAGVDVASLIVGKLNTNKRVKRQYGSPDTITSSNPLDTNCIDRPTSCDKTFPYRSISGWCNHDTNRVLGSTMNPFRRFMGSPKYDDGINSVRTKSAANGVLPSARIISNKIFAEASIPAYDPDWNHLFMQFGQFVAHDIVFTPSSVGPNNAALDCSTCESASITPNCAPIEIPDDDAYFPPKTSTGKRGCIRLTRAINGQTGLGPRAQINQNSHYLDMSVMYGSTDCVSKDLRTLKDGQMFMYQQNGYTLPPRAANDSNCQSQPSYLCFVAGDSRNSLHPGLIPLHTIYLRQHNKWAAQIRKLRSTWSDNLVYHETRRLVIAMWQYHTYNEYLPKVIGAKLMSTFDLFPTGLKRTYNASVDPSISVEFGAAAFRFGHSQARKDIPRMTNKNSTVGPYIDLGANIFYSDSLYDKSATVFNMAQGMVNVAAMAVDRQFSFPIRNQLFETRNKKASGVDLPAVNIQRGREMGVQPYNEVRAKIPGLGKVATFDDLKKDMDPANVDLLKKTYASVDDIDLYVGILLEKRVDPSAVIGPTGSYLIADQFSALKKGDRFFYQSTDNAGALTQAEYEAIRNYPLAQLICENTDGMTQVQDDIFRMNGRMIPCSSFQPFPMDRILY